MVFEDPTRKRWRYTISMFVSIIFGLVVISAIAISGIIIIPTLPIFNPRAEARVVAVPIDQLPAVQATPADMTRGWKQQQNTLSQSVAGQDMNGKTLVPKPKKDKLISAYILQSDANSVRSLRSNAQKIDIAYPDWFTIKEATCAPSVSINAEVTQTLKGSDIAIVPRLTNSDGNKVYAEEFDKILGTPTLTDCLIQEVIQTLKSNDTQGLIVDMDGLTDDASAGFSNFVAKLSQGLHKENRWLQVVVPAGNRSYDLEVLSTYSDLVVVGLNGEHYATSKSGPIASQDWFEQAFQYFYKEVPPEKLVVGIGSYAYDWNVSDASSTARSLTYGQALSIARQAGASPELEKISKNMLFGYRDLENRLHAVWLLDGVTLWNEWRFISGTGAAGLALWRLGSEDESFWEFAGDASAGSDAVQSPPALTTIAITGQPEIYKLSRTPLDGNVAISLNDSGFIIGAKYQRLPSGYELEAVGKPTTAKQLSVIIDGGPDPVWTPRILDLLDEANVPAVFFVTAPEAQKHPELLKVIADRGYIVGNRGGEFVNPDVISRQELIDNVNETQRVIQRELLAKARLYLRQYHSFSLPANTADAEHITDISQLGFFIVRANIDAKDWVSGAEADGIADDVMRELDNVGDGAHILAFQGSGDDREQTLAAMKQIIPAAKEKGFGFTGIDQVLGLAKNDVMPSLERNEATFARMLHAVMALGSMIWPTILLLFAVTTGFSLFRIILMYVFAIRSAKRKRPGGNPSIRYVSILIPAYNEEQTIGKTLNALLKSHHKRFEALVINDGSTDNTAAVVQRFVDMDPRIRLINKQNSGKAEALNLGMRIARYQIAVTIDADTILQPQAVDELIKPFFDKSVDAVCGNVEVGNVRNALTAFQALEYITAQNFDRNALDEVNAINVVPGATGAWNRKRVIEIGGYEGDTLTEDADLTIRMLAAGGKIVYAHNARSFTEAPQVLSDLAKQRFRWSFGTFQCLGKHYKLFFKGRVGWISLPNIFVFQIIFPLLAPIGDIVFMITLVQGAFGVIFWSYLFFTAMELASSLFAFVIDKKPKKLLLMAFIQRFYYRQFLYITIIRSIIAILRGKRYGWNKLERMGTVLEPT
ncbi:MAG: glycosyltransferase [Patescibacteria group bacterium]|nr:glycosyltransferase [Patescibacteria group bacterium]